ncbi:hypothetical protein C8J57DRAFT_1305267 [Mycena rebaudengoi]|nr:hypothetical protein C8J57DRAFT_1305267 [Mycena rebaudengoi]
MAQTNESGIPEVIFTPPPLVVLVVKLIAWFLLFLPSYLSALLYIGEKDAPRSWLFLRLTAVGLVIFTFSVANYIVLLPDITPPCRLTEPFALYLVVATTALRISLSEESEFTVAHPFLAFFWLGCVFPGGVVFGWNMWMQMISDGLRTRHFDAHVVDHVAHRIIDIEYLSGFSRQIPNLGWSMFAAGKCSGPGVAESQLNHKKSEDGGV